MNELTNFSDPDFQLQADVRHFEIRDVEGGIVNVGQSWNLNTGPEYSGGGDSMTEEQGSNRGQEPSIQGSGHASLPCPSAYPHAYPMSMEALIAQVQWLQYRMALLEHQLQEQGGFSGLRRVQFRVDKLYVKELSGALNIGVNSIGGAANLSPLQQIGTINPSSMNETDSGDDLWMEDEPPGDLW